MTEKSPVAVIVDDARPGTPDDPLWRDADDHPLFRHRPKVVGAEISFRIERDAIAWSDGRHAGKLPLHQIEYMRLSFRPANLYVNRYRVEVRQRLGHRVWFSNVSYRGMVEMEAHDAPFAAFTRELARRIAKGSPKARFLGGEPAWRYWPAAAVTALLGLSLLYILYQALITGNWGLGFIGLLVGGYTAWLMGLWLRKNRPADFDPADIPAELLPPLKNHQP